MPRKKKIAKTFDLLDDNDYVDQVKDAMLTIASKRKGHTNIDSYENVRKNHLEFVDNIYIQHTLGMKGLPYGTLIEIIGQDGIGKTSLIWTIAGYAMQQNAPFLLVESEGKSMDRERVKRCLSNNPEIAEIMVKKAMRVTAMSILRASEQLEDWVKVQREVVRVPKDIPLVCAVDSFSKLMAPKEASGREYYEDVVTTKKAKTLQELGEGTNFEHAKYAQKWCRTLPSWLEQNNVILLIVSHQNQKVDMGFGGGSFGGEAFNRTKIGGVAFNQNASLQLIVTREGYLVHNGEKIGEKIKATVVKNSYGPAGSILRYELISRPSLDSETYQQPSLFFDNTTAEWFAAQNILGTTVSRKRYTCDAIGAVALTGHDFCKKLYENPEIITRLSIDQNILGYPTRDTANYEFEKVEEIVEDEQSDGEPTGEDAQVFDRE